MLKLPLAILACTLLLGTYGFAANTRQPAQPSETAGVVWIVFVDDLHVSFVQTGRLREWLRTIAEDLLAPDDLIALASSGLPDFWIHPTPDHGWLTRRSRNISGLAMRSADGLSDPAPLNELRERSARAATAACSAITRTKQLVEVMQVPQQRVAMVYISNGYEHEQPDAGPHCDRSADVIQVATTAGVSIFTFDAKRLDGGEQPSGVAPERWQAYWTATQSSLKELAGQTDGIARLDNTDLSEWLKYLREMIRR